MLRIFHLPACPSTKDAHATAGFYGPTTHLVYVATQVALAFKSTAAEKERLTQTKWCHTATNQRTAQDPF